MALENLRQKCIYYESELGRIPAINPISLYWDYMSDFSKLCADLKNPIFNTLCSESVMILNHINIDKIKQCMNNAITDKNNYLLLREDKAFLDRSVFKVPTIIINGETYQGMFSAVKIFEEICSHIYSGSTVQSCIDELSPKDIEEQYEFTEILILSIAICFIILFFLYLYKRSIERSLDETITEKIKKQAHGSLGEYHIFNSNDNSMISKGIEIVKS